MTFFVYVIKSEDGLHKIGVSNAPERRLSALRTNGLNALKLVKTWEFQSADATWAAERGAHTALAQYRVVGEWFEVTEDAACAAVDAAVHLIKKEPRAPKKTVPVPLSQPAPLYSNPWDSVLRERGLERVLTEVVAEIRIAAEKIGVTA